MNAETREIARLLKITISEAYSIQEYIDNNWLLDWSECSERKFRKVVREVAKELQVA
jgi:hypothetical protein